VSPEQPAGPEEPLRRLPPPAVWEGIAAATGVRSAPDPEAVRRSLGDGGVGGDRGDRGDTGGRAQPAGPPAGVPAQRTQRRWSTPVLLGAAGLALVVGAAAGALVASRAGGAPAVVVVSTAQLAPLDGGDASRTGTAEVVGTPGSDGGRRVVVTTAGLPAVDGAAHEVWLLDPASGGLVALGSLADGRSPQGGYVLPDGVDLSRFSEVDVSAEPLDGDTAHSGASELRGPLSSTTA